MLDPRADSIIYQAQVKIAELADTLVSKKRLGKPKDETWEKILLIRRYLKALEYKGHLDDISEVNYILECLITLTGINEFPAAPVLNYQTLPNILTGRPGPKGDTGDTGAAGTTGMATDFQVSSVTISTVIDSFPIGHANGARWDYTIIKSNGAQRTGSVLGTWNATGTALDLNDFSTSDITASTAELEFDLNFSGGNIQLLAVPTGGTWNIVGSRYFIPNNGNGSGPVGDVLADGKVYIGNASNQATAQTVSGVISITNTGVTSFTAGAIVNADINVAAAIALSKLAALTADRVAITNGSGVLSVSSVTAADLVTKLGYVDTGAGIQGLINTKLTNPLTTNGDLLVYAGGVPTRLGIGSPGQVLTVSGGLASWQNVPGGISGLTTDYLPVATSATTLGNSVLRKVSGSSMRVEGDLEIQAGFRTQGTGPYFKIKVIDIGDWNMDTTGSVSIAHGLQLDKIRSISVMIRTDNTGIVTSDPGPLDRYDSSNTIGGTAGGVTGLTASNVVLTRATGGNFDNASFDQTSHNRGWITIVYESY